MSDRRTFLFLRLFTAFCLAITFSITVFLAWTSGPYVEKWLFGPVVSKLRIVSIDPAPGGHTFLSAEFTKLRDCDYLGIAWFRRYEAGFERVAVELMRSPGDTSSPNRPLGKQRAGPWKIHLTPSELKANSFSQLSHSCHGLWLTTTEFYP